MHCHNQKPALLPKYYSYIHACMHSKMHGVFIYQKHWDHSKHQCLFRRQPIACETLCHLIYFMHGNMQDITWNSACLTLRTHCMRFQSTAALAAIWELTSNVFKTNIVFSLNPDVHIFGTHTSVHYMQWNPQLLTATPDHEQQPYAI